MDFQAGDQVATSALEKAEKEGTTAMDKAIQLDGRRAWQGALTAAELQPCFQLPAVIPLPVLGEAMMARQTSVGLLA